MQDPPTAPDPPPDEAPVDRVRRAASVLARQARTALQDPSRVRRVLEPRYWRELRFQVDPPDRGRWTLTEDGRHVRRYDDYEDYLEHQRSKLDLLDLSDYDRRYRVALRDRLVEADLELRGRSVLCLAARIGTEVRAFGDMGAFAVGIDLNPGPDNRYVLPGDFHDLQFADGTVDAVFTNSLDHALEPERLAAEVRRVLKPGGLLVLELATPQDETTDGQWEAFMWSDHTVALDVFTGLGFRERHRSPVDYPEAHDLFVVLEDDRAG